MVKSSPELCTAAGRCGEVQATWAARAACYDHSVLFMDTGPGRPQGLSADPHFKYFEYNGDHDRWHLGRKEIWQWGKILELHPDIDWVIGSDDDTYFVVDNVMRHLKTLDPSKPMALGRRFYKVEGGKGFIFLSGGAGYIFSRAAFQRLASVLGKCDEFWGKGPGDTAIGRCLSLAGVNITDSRDERGRERFHPFSYEKHFSLKQLPASDWYRQYSEKVAPLHEGKDCCGANETFSFHYMSGEMRGFVWPPPTSKAWRTSSRASACASAAGQAQHGGARPPAPAADACRDLVPDPPRVVWMVKTQPSRCTAEGACGELQATWAARAACYKQTVFFMDVGSCRAAGLSEDPHFRYVSYTGPHATFIGKKELWQWRSILRLESKADWVVSGEDATYFVVDSVLRYLKTMDPSKPVALGRKFMHPDGFVFLSGGAGQILSRVGLRRADKYLEKCDEEWGAMPGDTCAGKCWNRTGLQMPDTRDSRGRQRLHPFNYWQHSGMNTGRTDTWYYKYSVPLAPLVEGADCCGAEETLSFHLMEGKMRNFTWPPRKSWWSSVWR